uniref:Secreted venom protein family 3 protein n=1 Tax=Pristhesancus plagipennis TaxID=1955184 RepID=A0A2K8JM01_PRIPG|nr:secreted venom protein family 3 protein [Pristhesancus plagipennis]
MDTKLVLLLVLLGVVSTSIAYPKTDCGSGPTHDLLLGQRVFGDRLLYSTHETMDSTIFRKKVRDIYWPTNLHPGYNTITRIEVYDQLSDGKGGCAFLADGGVGNQSVKLHLKTQRGGKFDFLIAIYGR